jgi:hypothetical protein
VGGLTQKRLAVGANDIVPRPSVVKMYFFLIEFVITIGYLLASAECARYLTTEKKLLAFGSWLLARKRETPKRHSRGAAVPHDPLELYAK